MCKLRLKTDCVNISCKCCIFVQVAYEQTFLSLISPPDMLPPMVIIIIIIIILASVTDTGSIPRWPPDMLPPMVMTLTSVTDTGSIPRCSSSAASKRKTHAWECLVYLEIHAVSFGMLFNEIITSALRDNIIYPVLVTFGKLNTHTLCITFLNHMCLFKKKAFTETVV